MGERCECCDLPVESCGKAVEQAQRAEEKAERARLLRRGFIEARYDGRCANCGAFLAVGSLIAHVSALGHAVEGWIGECCAAAIERASK